LRSADHSGLPAPTSTSRTRAPLHGGFPAGTSYFVASFAATIPAKRFGDPDEFGAACAFLCSARAGYITGQNLLIDGGTFNGAF
jgi:NAD(P)-dependent dehydrogenase (short-subunit alcohol dehydrogenase family)